MVVDCPGTTQELAQRFGVRVDALRPVLCTMRDFGLIVESSFQNRHLVWSTQGPPIKRRRAPASATSHVSTAAIFCRVAVALMGQASSRDEIVEWGEITRQCLRQVLNAMQDLQLVFVEDWRRRIPSGGAPIPLFRFGIDKDSKRRPATVPLAVIHHRKREVRKRRAEAADMTFLTAGRVRPVPTKSNERTL